MLKLLWTFALLALLACGSGRLEWQTNCVSCGIPPNPDAGPGSCPTEQAGNACSVQGQACTISADPCTPGLLCETRAPTCPSGASP